MSTILFPSEYGNVNKVDWDYQCEYEAAIQNGFDCLLFSFDDWVGSGSLKLDKVITEPLGVVIYRGWMMKPVQYQKLYEVLQEKGITLLNTPEQYEVCHVFQNAYPYVEIDTAKSMFFPLNEQGELPEISGTQILQELGTFFIKDYVKSVKGYDFPKYFASLESDEEFQGYLERFIRLRGDLFTGGICAKSYLQLKRYDENTNEYRVFYLKGEILSISRNSNQPLYTKEPPTELIEKYAKLPSLFYTIDYAQKEDGDFVVIETGDGGVSGLSPNQDAQLYYRRLKQIQEYV